MAKSPDPPANPSSAVTGTSTATVYWDMISGDSRTHTNSHYDLWVDTNTSHLSSGTSLDVDIDQDFGGVNYARNLTSLTAGATYYWKVRAYHPDGTYTNSDTGVFTANQSFTTVSGLGSAPDAPTIAFSAKTTSAITVSWSSVTDATNYKIYFGTSADPTSPGDLTGDVTSYQITSLSAGTTYYVRLKANNSAGDSGYSNGLTIDTLTATITDLTLSDNKPTRNDVAWTAPTGTALSYLVAGTSTNPTSVISDDITGAGAKTFEHTGLDPGDEYFYRVRTRTTNHNSEYSAYSGNSSQTNPVVPLPTSLGYTAGVHNINFDFTEPTYGERVYIYETDGGQLEKSAGSPDYIVVNESGDSNWDTSDWQDDNTNELITGGNQSQTVKYKTWYDSEYSSFTSTVTGYSLPAPPTAFAASATSDSQIDLSWVNPTGSALSETFTIQRKVSGGSFSSITTTATGTTYSDGPGSLDASTNYIYQISTNTTAGSSAYTGSTVNATTQAGASVSAGANLSLGALGKAVGANIDISSETALGADGYGDTGTLTRMQDFTVSAVNMALIDNTPSANSSTTVLCGFSDVGSLFNSKIGSRNDNFTRDETGGESLFTLTEASDRSAPIAFGSSNGDITFTVRFKDYFNDHATNYDSLIEEEAEIVGGD